MKFRIIYWLGSMTTETYVFAWSKEDAIILFEKVKGKCREDIIKIEEL